MATIDAAFAQGKALIAFITCGDPDLETTEKLIHAMAQAGVDLIELGLPFSDPVAEGPVIQAASQRALKTKITPDQIFQMLARLKGKVSVPLVFMTYANVVFSYGTRTFMEKAAQAGIAGLILPDVPYEERAEFAQPAQNQGLTLISMIAPTSLGRISRIAQNAQGFVYLVSSLGVTGRRQSLSHPLDPLIESIRDVTSCPIAIGFGISTPEQARIMADKANGIIVGSAIVDLIARHGRQAVPPVVKYIQSLRQALDSY